MNYQQQYDAYLARAKRALEEACRRYLPAESQVCPGGPIQPDGRRQADAGGACAQCL